MKRPIKMNANLLRNTYDNTRSWIFAISTTLAVHFILFAIFVPIEFNPTEINTVQYPQIMMLPLDFKDSNSKVNELIAWMNNENLGLITAPNNKFGYASIIKHDSSLPAPKDIFDYKTELLKQIIFLSSMNVPEIPVKYNTIKDFFPFLTSHPFAVFSMKLSAASQDKAATYPYVENLYYKYNLPVIFFNLGENNSLIKKYDPPSPTILKMHYPEDKSLLPLGAVIESCGTNELDKIGLDAITVQDFPDYIKNKLAGKDIFLKIDWQASYTKLSNKGKK